MELYGVRSASWPQKIWIIGCEVALLALSYPILFGRWGARFARWMGWQQSHQLARHAIIFAFSVVVFVRMTFMMVRLLRRQIPVDEAIAVPLAFGIYYIGFPLLTLRATAPLGPLVVPAVALFVIGSLLNTVSEVQRARWKARPENKGHLYTEGLFGLAIHINYFGDVLWVSGYAIVSGNPWSALVPLALFCMFAFYNVPKLDGYLRQHYGAEFAEYERTTPRLVPLLY